MSVYIDGVCMMCSDCRQCRELANGSYICHRRGEYFTWPPSDMYACDCFEDDRDY